MVEDRTAIPVRVPTGDVEELVDVDELVRGARLLDELAGS
jgi:hypothetical protein